MAYNVFGTPVTSSTLHAMPKYFEKETTRRERGLVALNLKNSEEKDKNARNYVEKLKGEWGDEVSTLCLIYNATGNPLTLVNYLDWHGCLGQSPLPWRIENGQWAAFLHTPADSQNYSEAAIVYRDVGKNCDFMIAWLNMRSRDKNNKAYSEVRGAGHWNMNNHWAYVQKLLRKSTLNNSDPRKEHESISFVSIGNGRSPILEAILTVEDEVAA